MIPHPMGCCQKVKKTAEIPLKLPKLCPFATCCLGCLALRWRVLAKFTWGLCFSHWICLETWKSLYFPTLLSFLLSPEHIEHPWTCMPHRQTSPFTRYSRSASGAGAVFFILFCSWHKVAVQRIEWTDDVLIRFSCIQLFDPMDCSLPGSPVHGILQARILEWVAMPSSRGSYQPRDGTQVSCSFYIGRQILYYWAIGEARTDDRWMNTNLFSFFSLSLFSPKSITYYINSNWMFFSLGKKGCPDKANVFSWSQPPILVSASFLLRLSVWHTSLQSFPVHLHTHAHTHTQSTVFDK